jgi:transposase
MSQKFTNGEMNKYSKTELINIVLSMQIQMDKLNENFENLIEQLRIANQHQFGRQSEKLDGQLYFFNECEYLSEENVSEPDVNDILPTKNKNKKQKGKRDADLKDFPEETFDHDSTKEQLDSFFGEDNWREMATEEYKRLRYEPASWTVEKHTVHVYVGTDGDHQDEFIRGERPKDLLRNSILTPSLGAAIINAKYVNSIPLNRIEQEFQRNGVNISRQTMANWVIQCANKYLVPMYDYLHDKLMKYHVTQADETPVEIIHDDRPAGSKSYMWVHRSGEFYTEQPIVLYEYQKTRHSDHPKEFYKNYNGILMTDGLEQYHKISRELAGLINANCWAHARRDYSDAVKAIGKTDEKAIKQSVAYQALARIATIYKLEDTLKSLSSEKRLQERKTSIKPLVEEYFAWVKERLSDTSCIPKGATAKGLNYSVNQEEYLKVFLTDGDVPIDNSASERSIRTFCIGKKNWVIINTIKGAQASAVMYSISETAKLNNLNPYYYFMHLLEMIPNFMDDQGNIETSKLDTLLPWSKVLPVKCYKPRR